MHTKEPNAENCHKKSSEKECSESYIQYKSDHTIAIAEYSERGNHFDETRYNDIIEMISEKSATDDGVVTIVFVHGWKHNSDEKDSNLINFRNVIAEIAKNKDRYSIGNRELVGVYVGWRGKSLKIPYLDTVSYWERKSTAEQFGNTGLTRLLLELDQIDRFNPRNVLVTIGHSFGGAAVLTATTKPLLTRLMTQKTSNSASENICDEVVCGIGDGVFLINPAVEANQIMSLLEPTIPNDYSDHQPPLLVTLSSEADGANKYLFPLGQTAGLLATSRQTDLTRSYLKHSGTGELVALKEENLDATTVGNFAPLLTHRIDVPSHKKICSTGEPIALKNDPLVRCENYGSKNKCGPKLFPNGFDRTPKHVKVSDRSPYNPLYFIRTNEHFMGSHNDIFNPHVVAFLTAQLDQGLRAVGDRGGGTSGNSLYQNSDRFKEAYEKYLGYSCEIVFEQ